METTNGKDVFDPRAQLQPPVLGGQAQQIHRLYGFGDDWSGMTLLPADQWTIEAVNGRPGTAILGCWEKAGYRAYRLIRVDPPQDQAADADGN
jgi:hypothetical protein